MKVQSNTSKFFIQQFKLESGETLKDVEIAYSTYGKLAEDGKNGILIFHALTGSHLLAGNFSKENFPDIPWNEELEIGTNNFEDERGIISNYYFEDSINMIGYVESKKETMRGNHYHPIQTQKCLLIKGSYISITKDLSDKNSVIETRLVNEGDLSTIPPYVAHTMVFLEDSIFLNLVNGFL